MSGKDLKAMNKYGIPSKFRIANHYYNVELCQFIDNGDSFGIHDNLKLLIQVAECMKEDDGEVIHLTEEQIKNSFWHEVFHAFQYYYCNKQDESITFKVYPGCDLAATAIMKRPRFTCAIHMSCRGSIYPSSVYISKLKPN